MITKVWGIVNRVHVDFHEITDRPGWYEGFAPKAKIYQEIEIWAQNDLGAIGHVKTQVVIKEYSETEVIILLSPWIVELMTGKDYVVELVERG